jgi:molybdopterin molybdotransferase
MTHVLSFVDALATVLSHAKAVPRPEVETMALEAAFNRILAEPLAAPGDQPPFERATRDGFAVRSADIAKPLVVVGQVRAGDFWHGPPLGENEAIEIMTGAPLPAGADAVVMIEHTTITELTRNDITITIDSARTLRPGENVVPRGAEARAEDVMLPAGRRLQAAEIAVAASCGAARLWAYRQPLVAIIPTGDELVEVAASETGQPQTLAEAQIFNSNAYALRTLAVAEGAVARSLGIARDDREELRERIAQGSVWDLLLLSGGVSMGKYDLVEEVLTEFGAEFFFTGTLIQPGKPLVFGRIPKRGVVPPLQGPKWTGAWTYFFGLPGNPVSTQVCFHLFVAPLLRALMGDTQLEPVFAEARLEHDVKAGPQVLRFLPAELTSAWDKVTVKLVGWQGSGDVTANARGNCYCVLPIGVELRTGDAVRVLLR